jgi:dienelactone hydrolase
MVFGQHEVVSGIRGRSRLALATLGLAAAVGLSGCAVDGTAGSVSSQPISAPAGHSAPTEPAIDPAPVIPAVSESMVWLPAGDHQVPATLALPGAKPGTAAPGRIPAVLLLHGDLGGRDVTGNLFGREAADLAAVDIASLRIDFAGSGDSTEPDLALDYPNMVADATASMQYLEQDQRIDPDRVAVLGLSRGGSIAATLAGTLPGVAALVEWSGAVYNGYDEDPDAHQHARDNGFVPVDVGDRDFHLSLNWYDSIEQSRPLDDVAAYRGPVLAVVGADDDVVPPSVADVFLATVASKDTTLHTIAGTDHLFGAGSDDQSAADEALAVTTDWLNSRLVQ